MKEDSQDVHQERYQTQNLSINPVEGIIAKNGTIVPEDETVAEEDEIKVIWIIHGG